MTKKSEQPPPFVVNGQYEDEEWREIAANPERPKKVEARYKAGPRVHPYGPDAYLDQTVDGVQRWFESRDARDKYVRTHEADKPQRAEPSPVESPPEQVRAQQVGIDATARARGKART